jgi:hypothetical protein
MRCHGSCAGAGARALQQHAADVEHRGPHDQAEPYQEGDLAERVAFVEPADRHEKRHERGAVQRGHQRRHADARAHQHARAERRRRQLDRAEQRELGRCHAAHHAERDAAAQPGNRAAQQLRIGQRAQDVGHREA